MPTYDYECLTCQHRFEKFQSMTAEPESACPECGGPVKKLIGGGAGIIFRGSGFYITDYRSKEYKKQAKEDAGGGGSSSPSTGSGGAAEKGTKGGAAGGSTDKGGSSGTGGSSTGSGGPGATPGPKGS